VEELKEEWLKAGWTEGTLAHPIIDAWGTSDTEKSGLKWTVEQVRMGVHVTIGWLLIRLERPGDFRYITMRSDTLGQLIPADMGDRD
jgi:hypothetical protein